MTSTAAVNRLFTALGAVRKLLLSVLVARCLADCDCVIMSGECYHAGAVVI